MSSDGVLVINDRVCLSNSTNALTVFPKSPLKSKYFKSYNCTADFLIPDFTLAQLKSLKRIQSFPTRNKMSNNLYPIVTLSELLKQL